MSVEPKTRTPWSPTPEQFRAYLRREVELAIANITLNGSSQLSSASTVDKARERIAERVQGGPLSMRTGEP